MPSLIKRDSLEPSFCREILTWRGAFVSASLLLAIGGCGGSGAPRQSATVSGVPTASGLVSPSRSSASARFAVAWPARATTAASRLIPVAANSIKVTIQNGDTLIGSVVIARPSDATPSATTSGMIENLPAGAFTVTAAAYPNADGTGDAQASATLPVTLSEGELKDVPLTMASNIDHIEVSSLNQGADPAPFVWRRDTIVLSATARDASGTVIITALDKWQWTSGDSNRATFVSPLGNTAQVKAGATLGAVKLSVTETESGKQGTFVIKVRGYDLKKLESFPVYNDANTPSTPTSPFPPYTFCINGAGQIAGTTASTVWVWTPTAVGATSGTFRSGTTLGYGRARVIGLSSSGNVAATAVVSFFHSYLFYKPGDNAAVGLSDIDGSYILNNSYVDPSRRPPLPPYYGFRYTEATGISGSTPIGYTYDSTGSNLLLNRWDAIPPGDYAPKFSGKPTILLPQNIGTPITSVLMGDNGVIFVNHASVQDNQGVWHSLAAPPAYSGDISGFTIQADSTALGYYERVISSDYPATLHNNDYVICRWDATGTPQIIGQWQVRHAPAFSSAFIVQAGDRFLGDRQIYDVKTGHTIRYSEVLQDYPPVDISTDVLTGASSNGIVFLAKTASGSGTIDFYVLDPVE